MILLRWFAIIAALGFACSFTSGQYSYQSVKPDLLRRELRVRSPSSLRSSSESEGSCGQSEIEHNVTLRGGIRAGYFRKLAQYVAMKLCVELCCEEKGCDVAFMTGRNCYGVQCFSEEQCQSIPTKGFPSEQIFVSHVTFKGEGTQKVHEPKNLKCSATRMKVGVTLRGGLKAGNFTDVGKVDNMVICTKLCCVAERCDLAMMINSSCFLVACYTMELCQVVKAISNRYQPSVAYVMRHTGDLQEETATKLQALHTLDSKLMCKNSQIFYNSTLRGGYKAGNFTDLGKVPNMSACIRLCCGDKNCDAAFMLEKNCYAVACVQENLCTPVHAKKSGALISLNPRISYITSRTEEVASKNLISVDGSCHAGVISYDVTLRGGMSAGNFTPHGKVGSMETCIEKCCRQADCNAAMMLKDACFTVSCQKDELCEKKPIPTSSSYNPKIAFVYRDRKQKKKATKHPAPSFVRPMSLTKATYKHGTGTVKENAGLFKTALPTKNYHVSIKPPGVANRTLIKHIENKPDTFKGPLKETRPSKSAFASQHKPSSFHEMVEFITTGLASKSYTHHTNRQNNSLPVTTTLGQLTGKKSAESFPIRNSAHKSVKMNLKLPGSGLDHLKGTEKSNIHSLPIEEDAPKIPVDTYAQLGEVPTRGDVQELVKELEKNNSDTSVSASEESGDGESWESYMTSENQKYDSSNASLNLSESKHFSGRDEDFQAQRFPSLSLIGDDVGCTNSEIIKNVTLRGGIKAGKFRDRGVMEDFRQCIKICCLSKLCDLAFMLRNNCFTVECKSEELCEAVAVKTAKESPPLLAYIYARSSAHAKRDTQNANINDDIIFWKLDRSRADLHVSRRTVEVSDNKPSIILKKRWTASDSTDKSD